MEYNSCITCVRHITCITQALAHTTVNSSKMSMVVYKLFRLQVTDYRLHVTCYRLHVTGYMLQVTYYRLQVTGYRLHVTGYMLQVTGYLILVKHGRKLSKKSQTKHIDSHVRYTGECILQDHSRYLCTKGKVV